MQIFKLYLTESIIAINIIIYIICAIANQNFFDIDLEILLEFGASNGFLVVLKDQWYRLFTSMFLHGGLMHIVMNMFSLYIVGKGVELYFSRLSYILLYIFSGIVGSMVSLFIHPGSIGVGASGAIFGIFGAIMGFFVVYRNQLASNGIKVFKEFGVILGLNLIFGLSISSIDMSAHIGGLVVGFVGGYMISKNPKFVYLFGLLMILLIALLGYLLRLDYVSVYY